MFDNYQKLKIGDFGAVKEMMSTRTDEIGTAAYMSPEVNIMFISVCYFSHLSRDKVLKNDNICAKQTVRKRERETV